MAGSGALEGFVRLSGDTIPRPVHVENTTDPAVCGHTHTLEDVLVSAKNRGIQNVVFALTDVPEEKMPSRSPGRVTLDNRECRFSPHVSVMAVGDTLEAINSDPVLHTVHLYGAEIANLALPFEGVKRARTLDRPGLIIVKCDVHGWMQAFIRVDDHPFHAVSDTKGAFRIPNIPAGTYTLEAWHEKLGVQRQTIRIEAGKTEKVKVEYALDNK